MSSIVYLVDTNIISELARPNPNAGVVAWAQTTSSVGLSVVTVEEIFFCLHWKPIQHIHNWFESFLDAHCKIYPITDEITRCSGRLRGALAANGRAHTQTDMLIAATAQVERQTLVTRNVRDFEGCGIPVYDPFA
ncbi:MAG: type II toxin-antitoxin system VapC family toxin [Gammaproteobacteria bacterium]